MALVRLRIARNQNDSLGILAIPFCMAFDDLAAARETCEVFNLRSGGRFGVMRSALFSVSLVVLAASLSASPSAAQPMDIRPCPSFANPNERADCMRRSANATSDNPTRPTKVAPSFDCRLARTSVERAICGDEELADWDARMGQAFQQAMKTQRDPHTIQESQRSWIVQRDRTCGSTPEIPFSCLLEMTKQRAIALSQFATSAPPIASTAVPATAVTSVVPQAPNSSTPELAARAVTQSTSVTTSSGGDDGLSRIVLVVLFVGGLYFAVKIANAARRKQVLIAKYGDATAARILARQIWQGMTEEQLVDSWGRPVEIGSEVLRTKTKQIWKYGRTGKNRFRERVTVENGMVSGWKN
jgi:uncharacterized protein